MGGVHLIDSTSKSKAAVSKILLGEYDRVFVAVKQVLFEQPGKNGMSKKLSMTRKFNRPLSRRLDRCDRVIQNESRDQFGGKVYYVTMQITFLTRKFRNGERNLHCDIVHITTKWVSSLTLDCNGVFAKRPIEVWTLILNIT